MFLPRVASFRATCSRITVLDIGRTSLTPKLPLASSRQVHDFLQQRNPISPKIATLSTTTSSRNVAGVNSVQIASLASAYSPRRSSQRSFASFSASRGQDSLFQWKPDICTQKRFQNSSRLRESGASSSEPIAASAAISQCSEYLNISWANGEETRYPWVWLRDNCQCPACFQPSARARLSLMENFDVNSKPSRVTLDHSNQTVDIVWTDGHVSQLSTKWLDERSFTPKHQQIRSGWYSGPRVQWPPGFDASQIRRFRFDDVISSDRSLLDYLETLEAYGLVLIEGVPVKEGMVHKMADRIAFLRTTHYGLEDVVKPRLDPSNIAYTGAKLGLHTDLVYYDYMPGIQFLHCIQQAKGVGGENQFADGMAAAANIKVSSPDDYVNLTTIPVDFYDVGRDYYEFHKIQRRPVVESNREGEVHRINYNNQVRDSFLNIPLEKVKPLYKALKVLDTELRKNAVTIKLREGEMVGFDNMRVLHGRNSFNLDQNTSRHLQGGYTDWDEVRSRIRVLRSKLKTPQ